MPTPPWLCDRMVARLFAHRLPAPADVVVDPGCGAGDFIAAVLRFCHERRRTPPALLGVELDPARAAAACARFAAEPTVTILEVDYLDAEDLPPADFVIGNPPYVSLAHIAEADRSRFRKTYRTATGRFDLYMLFIERSLGLLKPGGRLSLVTPEKWLYVASAQRLRWLLAAHAIEWLDFVPEDAFPGFVTYPLVTQVCASAAPQLTEVALRDGRRITVRLPRQPERWPSLRGGATVATEAATEATIVDPGGAALGDLCRRIGCGPASGRDEAFLVDLDAVPDDLQRFAYPTISGKQLDGGTAPHPTQALLVPYGADGELLDRQTLRPLLDYLRPAREQLEARSCAARKPWFAYHERPAMRDLLRPKLLCKDITKEPRFYLDRRGGVLPRHSVYYLVPAAHVSLDELYEVVSRPAAAAWLRAHAQRAANGYFRIQSTVLKRMPVDSALVPAPAPTLFDHATATATTATTA